MKLRHLCAASLLAMSSSAVASDLNLDTLTVQSEFKALSKNLSAAMSYKPVAPTEALSSGLLPFGFDVGLEVSSTEIDDDGIFDTAFDGDAPGAIIVPKLHAHVGLPFGIDVGAFISAIPSTNIKLKGFELRYAILDGGTVTPAVGIRYAATSLSGVDNYELSTRSLDLSVSKGFLMLTPYAGIGKVWTSSDIDSSVLSSVDFSQNKLYAGVNLNLGLLNIAVEADKTGDYGSYSAKLGFRF
ncbi:hypothetical protein MNBD_GAMMA18-764 [hydrothermal vent metagenome]|uniref:Outer membrane protein beta-barrel domain-containing protein n=1 Tax=hydrothermal vent metagenome TaxID=652676 RepID=A0A3B0YSP6_9ZZZZ